MDEYPFNEQMQMAIVRRQRASARQRSHTDATKAIKHLPPLVVDLQRYLSLLL
jgi:hypothetical protein